MVGIVIALVVSTIVSILWVNGISNMQNKHPNYKGHDFLNWDGKNPWDDKKKEEENIFSCESFYFFEACDLKKFIIFAFISATTAL